MTQHNMDTILRYRGAMMGLATGDALGVPGEFQPRGAYPKITEMIGGGPFHLQPGEWTDDTSMALCLGKSLIDKNGFDAKDQMDKYWAWIENGYMSSNGRMFDIGDTTSEALCLYRKTGEPFAGMKDAKRAGNGSLMRLVPIPLFFPKDMEGRKYAAEMSYTTHGALTCVASCTFFTPLIHKALQGLSKEAILTIEDPDNWFYKLEPEVHLDIAKGAYKTKTEDQIRSTGFVIHTLEAALWSFYTTDTFEEGAIKAVNLGEDTDTVGAVYGQIAGAYYGISAIPRRWLDKVVLKDIIIEIADKLFEKRKV
jgi:ADP-ribosyl-[dinitrogen reductase] hydrolase